MPTLTWIGKNKIVNHHQEVPYRVLEHKYGFRTEDDGNQTPTNSGNKIIHGDNLDNVLFWHRNPSRMGFCINGYMNHYPDFIVRLNSGITVLLETKGDDRDNSDSRAKVELGRIWANKAGEQYRYFMVFDKQEMKGAVTIKKLLQRLSVM